MKANKALTEVIKANKALTAVTQVNKTITVVIKAFFFFLTQKGDNLSQKAV